MPLIWKDPIAWSAAAVATPLRYWFMVGGIILLHAAVLLRVYEGGFISIASGIALLCWFQLLFLYALRRLYQSIRTAPAAPGAG